MSRCLFLLAVIAGSLSAQTPMEVLQRVAAHYQSSQTYEVKGTASALLPGTSWKVTYEFDAHGVQPNALPLHSTSGVMRDFGTVGGGFTHTRVNPQATDPYPEQPITLDMFGGYHLLLKRLVTAEDAGRETIMYQGTPHQCRIIHAAYDASPEYRPHSQLQHRRLWVDTAALTVLREQRSSTGKEWTADVTETWFDRPVSAEMLHALERLDTRPKDRPEWVGRKLPDLTVRDLSGKVTRLADVKGPLLLDFWGSYCPPCKGATLHAQELARRYKSTGLTVLTFTEDNADDARLWAAHNGVELPIVLDPKEEIFRAFDVQGIPVTILVGTNGNVLRYWTDYSGPERMDAVLADTIPLQKGPETN